MRTGVKSLLVLAMLVAIPVVSNAQDLASFEKRVTVKKLDNGLTLIVLERPEAPVFSFFTHVDAGGAQEVPGITGLAHMFEHMAFKGTDVIGTTDFAAEKAALKKVEQDYAAYQSEKGKLAGRDEQKVAALEKAWKQSIDAADKYVVKNEFGDIIDREGGVGLNAFTSSDETGYFYSLPSNRLELWAYLESERFLKPVMREFYKERDVVQEERRMRTDSSPIGRLIEQFLATAYTAHTYGQPVVGYISDLQTFSATDAQNFFEKHYIPANMVVAVVGDVKASEVIPMVQKYFGRIASKQKPEALRTVEPKQTAERQVLLRETSQPFYIEGYHKPAATHKDNAAYEVMSDILSSGRTSRLYRSLVRDKKIAANASGFNGFPGEKYPNLFAFFAVPTPGHTPDEVRDAMRAEIETLKTTDVTAAELQMVKARAKTNLLRQLDDNNGLAVQLGTAHARYGDWRELFRQVEKIDKVTAADIRRVANETFNASNRTVGLIESATAVKGAAK